MEVVGDLVGELLGWLGDLLGPLSEHRVRKQAGHGLARGRIDCSLKVISDRQQGLSPRWRGGVAAISPGRLDFHTRAMVALSRRTRDPHRRPRPSPPAVCGGLAWLPDDCRITVLHEATRVSCTPRYVSAVSGWPARW